MATGMLLAAIVLAQATTTAPAPRLVFQFKTEMAPPKQPSSLTSSAKFVPRHQTSPRHDEREIICGMVVIKKSPDLDKGMLIPPKSKELPVRRIEPQVCRGEKEDPQKK